LLIGVQCPPLQMLTVGHFPTASCTSGPNNYQDMCVVICPSDYTFSHAPGIYTCQANKE